MKLDKGQVAAVTGAASGIGLALTRAFCERGLSVAMIDIEQQALDEAIIALRQEGHEVEPFICDVADADAVTRIAGLVHQRFGRVDILVNNAGVGGGLGPLWLSHPHDWTWTLGVNVQGVVNGVRAFVPRMMAQGKGHIVNMSSLAGHSAPPFLSPYVASKHAVVGLSESLAAELAATSSPVKVSVICPGVVESRIMTSDRNRPPSLQIESSVPPVMADKLRAFMEAALRHPITGEEFARRAIAGIENDDMIILTHPESNGQLRARFAMLKSALFAKAG